MFGAAEMIVGLWFLPVTLFIIIPLLMLGGWSIISLVGAVKRKVSEKTETHEHLEGEGQFA